MKTWPESVERVASVLRAQGVDARLEEFPEGTHTAGAAARAVGCEAAQIVKTLVFVCDDEFVLALVPGDRRADETKVATAAGAKGARVAKPEEVLAATGFEPGGVAPFPAPAVTQVLINVPDTPAIFFPGHSEQPGPAVSQAERWQPAFRHELIAFAGGGFEPLDYPRMCRPVLLDPNTMHTAIGRLQRCLLDHLAHGVCSSQHVSQAEAQFGQRRLPGSLEQFVQAFNHASPNSPPAARQSFAVRKFSSWRLAR